MDKERPWFDTGHNMVTVDKSKDTLRIANIILIIIWHYNFLWVFAFSAKSLHFLLSLAASFQFLIFSFF